MQPTNIHTMNTYSTALAATGQPVEAVQYLTPVREGMLQRVKAAGEKGDWQIETTWSSLMLTLGTVLTILTILILHSY
jgi:hypothetical protein